MTPNSHLETASKEIAKAIQEMDQAELDNLLTNLKHCEVEAGRDALRRSEGYIRMVEERGHMGCAQFMMLVAVGAAAEGMSDSQIEELCGFIRQMLNCALNSVDKWLKEGEYHIRKEAGE